MDWIHCNSCFKQPSVSEPVQFFLTSCGHFYCDPCLKPDNKEKCKVCQSSFTATLLSNQLRPDVQEYFQDTTDSMKKLLQIMLFQNSHRQKISAHSKQVAAKYKAAKEEMKKLFDANKMLKKRIADLEAALKKSERQKPPPEEGVHGIRSAQSQPSTPFFQSYPNDVGGRSIQLEGSGRSVSSNSSQLSQLFGDSQSSNGTWLTPNRLTLQYNKSLSNKDASSPSPDSRSVPFSQSSANNVTPQKHANDNSQYCNSEGERFSSKQNTYHDSYRNRSPQYSSQSTPLVHKRRESGTPGSTYSLSQSPTTPGYSPNTPGYSRSHDMPPPLSTHSLYRPAASPITPPTVGMSLVNIYSQRGRCSQK